MDRIQNQTHTKVFREVPALLTARATLPPKPRILSFGCSIGHELATLRTIFPESEVFGCDVHDPALDTAQRLVGHLAKIFRSSPGAIEAHGPYDLIVASAVLCVNPPKRISELFPFPRFEAAVSLLDSVLAPEGVFVITNASYRMQDTHVFSRYRPVRSDVSTTAGFVDIFAPDGGVFLKVLTTPYGRLPVRGPEFVVFEDEELIDCVFQKTNAQPRFLTLSPNVAAAPLAHFTTANTDGFEGRVPDGAIVITTKYVTGVDPRSGDFGAHRTISWPSLIDDVVHCRPPFWFATGPA